MNSSQNSIIFKGSNNNSKVESHTGNITDASAHSLSIRRSTLGTINSLNNWVWEKPGFNKITRKNKNGWSKRGMKNMQGSTSLNSSIKFSYNKQATISELTSNMMNTSESVRTKINLHPNMTRFECPL